MKKRDQGSGGWKISRRALMLGGGGAAAMAGAGLVLKYIRDTIHHDPQAVCICKNQRYDGSLVREISDALLAIERSLLQSGRVFQSSHDAEGQQCGDDAPTCDARSIHH